MLLTFVAFLVCFELPRREEDFEIQGASCIRIAGRSSTCTLVSLSMSRASLADLACDLDIGVETNCDVCLPQIGWVAGNILADRRRHLNVDLKLTSDQRRQLVLFLFMRPMHHIAANASMAGALRGLARRAFANSPVR
jgi:cellulose synthase (UDP-forming)